MWLPEALCDITPVILCFSALKSLMSHILFDRCLSFVLCFSSDATKKGFSALRTQVLKDACKQDTWFPIYCKNEQETDQ